MRTQDAETADSVRRKVRRAVANKPDALYQESSSNIRKDSQGDLTMRAHLRLVRVEDMQHALAMGFRRQHIQRICRVRSTPVLEGQMSARAEKKTLLKLQLLLVSKSFLPLLSCDRLFGTSTGTDNQFL